MTKLLRRFRPFLALPVALMAALLLSGQASAFIYTHTTGMVGPWSFADTTDAHRVICNYGPQEAPDYFYMTKTKVLPPTVFAADRDSGKVDRRAVSWQFQIQRKLLPDGKWKIVGSSAVQRAVAKDNQAAAFTPLVIKHNAHNDGGTPDYQMRVQVTIKWYKPSGAVEGSVFFRPSYYYHVAEGYPTFVGSNPFCSEVITAG